MTMRNGDETAVILPPKPLPVSVAASLRTLSIFAGAVALAVVVHLIASKNEPPLETRFYTIFLCSVLVIALITAPAQIFWPRLRRWRQTLHPILTATALLLCLWEIITSGVRLLPLPYFPGPAKVLHSLITDRMLLFDSTWHSLILLLSGYTLGVIAGLITGLCIGWSPPVRYWGMPLLKVVGPIPATAWIPLAMVVSPSAMISAVALIALAVWFPVTMLTASGISNTRASYLDVARTLGAGRELSDFPCRHARGDAEYFHRTFHGTWRLVPDPGRRGNGRRQIRPRLVFELGTGLGRVRKSLCRARHHGSVLLHDHDALFKVRDRMLVWQKGVIKW